MYRTLSRPGGTATYKVSERLGIAIEAGYAELEERIYGG
jgi:hypothetical protein